MLNDIVRLVLLAEVRAFVSQDTRVLRHFSTGASRRREVVGNDDLVHEIRNVLWMPQGVKEHARIILAASGIDPEREGRQKYERNESGKYEFTFESALSLMTKELTALDRHMSDFIVRNFGRLRGEVGPNAVSLPKSARAAAGAGAYDLMIKALQTGFSSSVDTRLSRERGGKIPSGPLSVINDRDLVDVVIDDMIEIVLSHDRERHRTDFDQVEEEMQRLADMSVKDSDTQAEITTKLAAVLAREVASARSKAVRQEQMRGARVPDTTVRKMISNIEGLFKLFLSRVVSKDAVPASEYGLAFASLLCKACEIEDDYKLPEDLARMSIDPILPKEIDDGIVDLIRAVHTELMGQIARDGYLQMVYHVLVDQEDLYDAYGRPTLTYTFDQPHPAYDD